MREREFDKCHPKEVGPGLISRRLPTADDYYEFPAAYTARANDFRTWTNQESQYYRPPCAVRWRP